MSLLSPEKLLMLGLVLALLLGPRRLPALARKAGSGIRELREQTGLDDLKDGVRGGVAEVRAAASSPLSDSRVGPPPPAEPVSMPVRLPGKAASSPGGPVPGLAKDP